jgi:hypothetical protein
MASAQLGYAVEVIYGPGIHGSRGADDQKRSEASSAIRADRLFQRCQVYSLPAVHCDQPQRLASQSGEIKRSTDTSVHGDRGIGGQFLSAGCDAALANIWAQTSVPRYQYREQVGHRRTGDEEAARCWGKMEQGAHPVGYLLFDLQRDLVAAAGIGVQPRGQHLGQHAYHCSAALYPAQKTWVSIARREGQNRGHKLCVNLRQRRGPGGKIFPKARAYPVRDHLPRGKFAHVFNVPEHVV